MSVNSLLNVLIVQKSRSSVPNIGGTATNYLPALITGLQTLFGWLRVGAVTLRQIPVMSLTDD